MLQLQTRRFLLSGVFVSTFLVVCVVKLSCRIVDPPYMADVRALAESAPVVFRGQVVEVHSVGETTTDSSVERKIATFQVDRMYRGTVNTEVSLNFAYDWFMRGNGHYCMDFQPNTYWLVFAVEKDGRLELSDDCDGALTVSPILGPDLGNASWLAQMETDFLAGLADSDPAIRLISIQRLGGLGLASSRDALHRIIETGNKEESKWAIYAALRTGDITVLPKVKELLAEGNLDQPQRAMALQLQYLSDPAAEPNLLAILNSANGDLTRKCALTALGEKLRDPKAVPSLASHLSDPDHDARYLALNGLRNITHENACTLPPNWKEQDVEPQIEICKSWWEAEGKFEPWPQD